MTSRGSVSGLAGDWREAAVAELVACDHRAGGGQQVARATRHRRAHAAVGRTTGKVDEHLHVCALKQCEGLYPILS